jgi:hypothetical protein
LNTEPGTNRLVLLIDMRRELKELSGLMWAVIGDAKASRIERIEAAKIVLSCYGCLIPDVNETWLSARQIVKLRTLKQGIVEKVLRRKERRKRQNRRAYLRRRIREAEKGTSGEQVS